jgi:hypothetical protein
MIFILRETCTTVREWACCLILSENFQNPIAKIIERDKIDTPNTQIHDRSLSCLGTGTSIKSGRVKLILWAQASPLAE